jgi:hypothetical protein
MIRGGSNGLRTHFTRATIPTCRLPQGQGSSRSRQSSTGVSARRTAQPSRRVRVRPGGRIGGFPERYSSRRTGGLYRSQGERLRKTVLMGEDRSLADLAKWPASRTIRHAYEEVLTACARLVSFSTGSPPVTDGPISERQDILAVEDLIQFAIHARRLIEGTGQVTRFNKTEILVPKAPKHPHIRIWRVLNAILHHQTIMIIRNTWSQEMLLGKKLEEVFGNPNEYFPPLVSVISDRDKLGFPIRELIETFQERSSHQLSTCAPNSTSFWMMIQICKPPRPAWPRRPAPR